jgi:hypothetical protein
MQFIVDLWLPIVVSAVAVFIASNIIWMATPLHKHDYRDPGAAEEPIMSAVRQAGLGPGVYMVPWCHGKEMKDPSARQKMKEGPWAQVLVQPGPPSMGKLLGLWIVNLLIVSTFAAYMLSLSTALHPEVAGGVGGAAGMRAGFAPVFRVTGTAALMMYAGYALPMSIWHGQPFRQIPGRILDGIVYACVTGAVFGGLVG